MLDWEAATLTHSSAGAVVPVLALLLAVPEPAASSVAAADADCAGVVAWSLTPVAAGAAVCAAPDAVEPLADGLGEGDGEAEGDEGDAEGDGEAVGVGVPDEGIAWHAVPVLAFVGAAEAACAVPSAARARKPPLSKVTAATLSCAERIRMACLRCSSGRPCALRCSSCFGSG